MDSRPSRLEQTAAGPPRAGAQHFGNLDFIRLAAAMTVVFSHAFLLIDGTSDREPVRALLGGGGTLGDYGVFVFFIVSGFLITASALHSSTVVQYFWKRALRIYPGLIVCAVLSGLVLAPVFTTVGQAEFWSGLYGPKYALATIVLPAWRPEIHTVAFYETAQGAMRIVNGSLWTIPQEMLCYVITGALAAVRLLRLWTVALIAAATFAADLATGGALGIDFLNNFVQVAPAFFAGATVCLLWRRGAPNRWIAAACLVVLAAALPFGLLDKAFPLVGAYPFLLMATSARIRLPSMDRIGDISYGTYLYGWPAALAVRAALGPGASWWQLFLLSAVAALALGFLSWRLVEAPALQLKRFSPAALLRTRRPQLRALR